jgi:bilin biosynthesis protein
MSDLDPLHQSPGEKAGGLIGALADEDPAVRQEAARELGRLRDSRAIAPLISCLEDRNERVRWAAADSLLEMGEAAVEPLLQALEFEDKYARAEAAGVLGRMKDERAIGPLIDCLKDDDSGVR